MFYIEYDQDDINNFFYTTGSVSSSFGLVSVTGSISSSNPTAYRVSGTGYIDNIANTFNGHIFASSSLNRINGSVSFTINFDSITANSDHDFSGSVSL